MTRCARENVVDTDTSVFSSGSESVGNEAKECRHFVAPSDAMLSDINVCQDPGNDGTDS